MESYIGEGDEEEIDEGEVEGGERLKVMREWRMTETRMMQMKGPLRLGV